jgi:hypothetical protein
MSPLERLSALCEQLKSIQKSLDNLASAIRATTERNSDRTDREIKVRAEVRLTEAEERQRRAEQEKQTSIQCWIARGTWAAFIAAVIYAGISCAQWNELRTQTAASVISETGWLEILMENIKFSDQDTLGNRVASTKIWIRDRGKTPLTGINAEVMVRAVTIKDAPTFTYEGPRTCHEIGIIYPDYSKSDDPVLALANNPAFEAALGDDQPEGGTPHRHVRNCRETGPIILLPSKQVSPSEYQHIMGGQELIVVRAKTTYLDIFQKRHWIHTCRILSASGEVGPHM